MGALDWAWAGGRAVHTAGELATMRPVSNMWLVRNDMWTFYRLDNKNKKIH